MLEMTRQEELHSIYWEMYKSAHGIRPRGIDTSGWTEADFNREFENLDLISELNCRQQQADEQIAIQQFEDRVTSLMHTGTNRERVIAWLMDAENANGDHDYFCFCLGLPYGYFRKAA